MGILLCAATELEIEPTLHFIQQQNNIQQQVDILITGVGLVAATYHLTRQIVLKRPQFIIQAGVAGCLNTDIGLGEIVIIGSERVGDAVVFERGEFTTLFQLGLAHPDRHPWTNGQLKNNNLSFLRQSGLKVVDSITVNEITTNPDRIAYYKNKLKASVESLEGAALHYAALMENIPFLQLRSISNYIGERNKKNWRLKEAIAALNYELPPILLKLMNP